MCGGSDIVETHRKHNLGIAIEVDLEYWDGKYYGLTIKDLLLRPAACCWGKSQYIRDLSEHDLVESQISYSENILQDLRDLNFNGMQRIEARVVEIIQERREQIERVVRERAEEAERENQPRCMIL